MKLVDKQSVAHYIEQYAMTKHPSLKGYMAEAYRATRNESNLRSVGNSVYFMMVENDFLDLHIIHTSDKLWHYIDGSPLHVCIITSGEQGHTFQEVILGNPMLHAHLATSPNIKITPVLSISSNQWVAAKLIDTASFAFFTCTVMPEYDATAVETLTNLRQSVEKFPELEQEITNFYTDLKQVKSDQELAYGFFSAPKPQSSLPKPDKKEVTSLYQAPDGSEIRELLTDVNGKGVFCHCTLPTEKTTRPMQHQTVEEYWHFLTGIGELWLSKNDEETVYNIEPGYAITIPAGVSFQFRNTGSDELTFTVTTIPYWPGPQEAKEVVGKWPASTFSIVI